MPENDSATKRRAHPLPPRSSPAAIYTLLLAGAFLVYAAANAVVPVAGELRAELGLSGSGAALFLLPFAAGFGVGSFAWFATARHRSPRLLLPLSLAIVAAASVPLLFPMSAEVAVAARFVVGLGAAGYPAVAQAVITRAVAPAARGRMIGGFIMAVVAGSFAGQAIAGAVADLVSVDAGLALVCIVAPLLTAVALWRALSGVPSAAPAPSAAATDDAGGTSSVHLAALLRRQWPVLVVAFLSFGGYWLLLSQLPVALRDDRFALTAAQAGALPTIGLLGIVTAWAAGRMADRRGQRLPLVATLGLGIAGLAVTLPEGGPLWVFAVGYGAFLAAYWGYMPPASAEVAARSDAAERQPALMAFYAAMWSGAALAPALGAVLSTWTGAAAVVLAAWVVALAVGAVTFRTADGLDSGGDGEESGGHHPAGVATRAP